MRILIWYYLLSHALEYLHKQQYLIGLARTRATIYAMHFLKLILCMFCSAPMNGALITPS